LSFLKEKWDVLPHSSVATKAKVPAAYAYAYAKPPTRAAGTSELTLHHRGLVDMHSGTDQSRGPFGTAVGARTWHRAQVQCGQCGSAAQYRGHSGAGGQYELGWTREGLAVIDGQASQLIARTWGHCQGMFHRVSGRALEGRVDWGFQAADSGRAR